MSRYSRHLSETSENVDHDEVIKASTSPGTTKYRIGSEDLVHGQVVIITARWIMVATGLLLSFWNPGPINELRVQVLVILGLAGANFYLHAQLLTRRPVINPVIYLVSGADLAVISILVIAQGGFSSNVFTFYYPALLAISVAFPTAKTLTLAGSVMVVYAIIATITLAPTEGNFQLVIARMIMLAAVPVCGNMYWRIEGERRQAALVARQEQPVPAH